MLMISELYCCKCNKEIREGKDDHYLGNLEDPLCKHWCSSCFPEIMKFIEKEKYNDSCLREEKIIWDKIKREAKRKVSRLKGQTSLEEFK